MYMYITLHMYYIVHNPVQAPKKQFTFFQQSFLLLHSISQHNFKDKWEQQCKGHHKPTDTKWGGEGLGKNKCIGIFQMNTEGVTFKLPCPSQGWLVGRSVSWMHAWFVGWQVCHDLLKRPEKLLSRAPIGAIVYKVTE